MNPIDLLIIASAVLTTINCVFQLWDWHSTSEVIKYRLGVEGNKRLSWLNEPIEHRIKFWRLGAIKLLCLFSQIGTFAGLPLLIDEGLFDWAVVCVAFQGALVVYYAPIMLGNWRLLNSR